MTKLVAEFPWWMNVLTTGASLLVCGLGSKVDLLNKFCEDKLSRQMPCVVIKGFSTRQSGLDLCKDLIASVAKCFDISPVGASAQEQWKSVTLKLEEREALRQQQEEARRKQEEALDDSGLGNLDLLRPVDYTRESPMVDSISSGPKSVGVVVSSCVVRVTFLLCLHLPSLSCIRYTPLMVLPCVLRVARAS